MIWLASYPRSGNTFMRNILYHVYGLESSVHHNLTDRRSPKDFYLYPVVKTHLLPNNLDPLYRNEPSVYIVRDGRDAIVSEAWHHKNFKDDRKKVRLNMLEAIFAADGSHFGGWSVNVVKWLKKADLIIRFEDLIADPLKEAEKLRDILDLPEPKPDKIPTFEDQKMGNPRYGRVNKKGQNQQFFRKGKRGNWQKEMPKWMHEIFWRYHGEVMEYLGYHKDGSITDHFDIEKRKQKVQYLPLSYPKRTVTENIRLLMTKYGFA